MNPLVSPGFSHYQDTLQTGSIITLCVVININNDQYGKEYCDYIFCHIAQPYIVVDRVVAYIQVDCMPIQVSYLSPSSLKSPPPPRILSENPIDRNPLLRRRTLILET